jgi:hypothetical protein
MNIKGNLPKNKHDFESIEALKRQSKAELRGVLPELIKWLQDGNWPISKSVEDILLRFGKELIPLIRRIFQTNDGQWKYFVLSGLVNRLPLQILTEIRPDLMRIKNSPTRDEKLEELDELADELLKKLNL